MTPARRDLLRIYRAALSAVDGRARVAAALARRPTPAAIHLLALGKAAEAMAEGAWDVWGDHIVQGLLITKHGHVDRRRWAPRPVRVIEAGHPLPDHHSLEAGDALLRYLAEAPADARFLFLISGGASALAEALAPGASLEDLQGLNRHLLASGADIHAINRIRKAVSRLKGGRLARALGGRAALALLISDVRGDDPAVIGSGPLTASRVEAVRREELPPEFARLWLAEPAPGPDDPAFAAIELELIARNDDALAAAAERAAALGYAVHRYERFVDGEAAEAGERLARELAHGPAGIHLWGGEPTVTLPPRPGRGGRAQSLALAAATVLDGRDGLFLLAAGSDGSDGPGDDAGALVDGATLRRCRDAGIDPLRALAAADAGTALAASGDLIQTGPTGSNVMDIMIGLKTDPLA